jgi:hypothetical protein
MSLYAYFTDDEARAWNDAWLSLIAFPEFGRD